MKKVLLLGATGMLGSAVYGVLKDSYQLGLAVRNPDKIGLLERVYGGTGKHKVVRFDAAAVYGDFIAKKGFPGEYFSQFLRGMDDADIAINAIGVTIPYVKRDPAMTFFANGVFPHLLAQVFGERLIHITTDCVYNGMSGFPYNEESPKSPVDLYGLSKSLGEPAGCLTIRTSIIGRELDGFTGLLEWFRQQDGETITGFAEHYWNGITTQQFGEICHQIMQARSSFPRQGVYHVFSTVISKYEMLLAFRRKFGVRCTIREDHANKLDRTLATRRELNGRLAIPAFEAMIEALGP